MLSFQSLSRNIIFVLAKVLGGYYGLFMDTNNTMRAGDLAVFVDYAGREVGCTVRRTWAAGEISREAQIEVSVAGLSAPAPYRIGQKLTLDANKVLRAL